MSDIVDDVAGNIREVVEQLYPRAKADLAERDETIRSFGQPQDINHEWIGPDGIRRPPGKYVIALVGPAEKLKADF